MRLKKRNSSYLQMTKELVKSIYSHVDMLTDSKYREPIKILRTRHKGYEPEDFVQDAVRNIIHDFPNKKFENLQKFKAFMNKSVEWTYLKEKRKYFWTKSRGGSTYEVSLDDSSQDEQRTLSEIIPSEKSIDFDTLLLKNLLVKDLYILYTCSSAKVGSFNELKRYRKGNLLSVETFILRQIYLGRKDTILWYKEHEFNMTQAIFDLINQSLISYFRLHDLLVIEDEPKKHVPNKISAKDLEEFRLKNANKCTCGFVKEDYELSESTWQCPICGKIHDRDLLIAFNSGETSKYYPKEAKSRLTKAIFNNLNSSYISIPI